MSVKRRVKENVVFPLLMALSLLTRLPVTRYLPEKWDHKQQGLSPLFYPVVGAVLSLILYSLSSFLPASTSPIIVALCVLILWIVLTGALHLDGLADSTDAAFFSHRIFVDKKNSDGSLNQKNVERILSVFKDPAAGPMAVISLLLVILLKLFLLSELVHDLGLVLVASLVLSRTSVLLLIVSTPYVSPSGLASAWAGALRKDFSIAVAVAVALFFIVCLPFSIAVTLVLLSLLAILLLVWRQFWLSRIGGFVGDCAGALIELSETLILLVLYFAYL